MTANPAEILFVLVVAWLSVMTLLVVSTAVIVVPGAMQEPPEIGALLVSPATEARVMLVTPALVTLLVTPSTTLVMMVVVLMDVSLTTYPGVPSLITPLRLKVLVVMLVTPLTTMEVLV